jgi:hypothetical protein
MSQYRIRPTIIQYAEDFGEWFKAGIQEVADAEGISVPEAFRIGACEYWQSKSEIIRENYAKLKKLRGE